jgi:hypothetical protein
MQAQITNPKTKRMVKADGKVAHELYKSHVRKEIVLSTKDFELLKGIHESGGDEFGKILSKIEFIGYKDAIEFILKRYGTITLYDASKNAHILRVLHRIEAKPRSFWDGVNEFENHVWQPHPEDETYYVFDPKGLRRFERSHRAFLSEYKKFLVDAHFFKFLLSPYDIEMLMLRKDKEHFGKYWDVMMNDSSEWNYKTTKSMTVNEMYAILKSLPFESLVSEDSFPKRVPGTRDCNMLISHGF